LIPLLRVEGFGTKLTPINVVLFKATKPLAGLYPAGRAIFLLNVEVNGVRVMLLSLMTVVLVVVSQA
jgi:hypothetical protein